MAPPPSSVLASPPSAPSDEMERDARARVRDRAHQIGAAAVAWRGSNGGACPTLKDVLGSKQFPPGAELDANGEPFGVQCFEVEVWVLSSAQQLVEAVRYNGPVVKPPALASAASPPDPPLSEAVIRSRIFPGAKRCYVRALAADPNLSPKVSIHADPTPDKCHVRNVKVTLEGGVSAPLQSCLANLLKALDFCDNGSTLQVPITFAVP